MRTLLWTALVAGIVMLVLNSQTAKGSRGYSILVPVAAPGLSSRVQEFGANHDWVGELERHDISLSEGDREELLGHLGDGTAGVEERRVSYSMRYSLTTPVSSKRRRAFQGAADLVAARLRLEAKLLAYPHIPNVEGRSDIAWRAFGSGFDERVRTFLIEASKGETDPGLRTELNDLLRRLEG